MFKYEGYAKDPAGNFTKSKLVGVANKVSYTVGHGYCDRIVATHDCSMSSKE